MSRDATEPAAGVRDNLLNRAAEAEALGRELIELAARLRDDAGGRHQAAADAGSGHAGPQSASPGPAGQARQNAHPARLAHTAAGLLALRQSRLRHLGIALAGDAAWDILLTLFAARLARRQPGFDELCAAGGGYPATTRRWISVLTGLGLVEPCGPAAEHARRLTLTRKGEQAMAACLGPLAGAP